MNAQHFGDWQTKFKADNYLYFFQTYKQTITMIRVLQVEICQLIRLWEKSKIKPHWD